MRREVKEEEGRLFGKLLKALLKYGEQESHLVIKSWQAKGFISLQSL